METGESVRAPLESLRKHAVIFAGSGSGKTVLIRRLIEECALNGVSAIVLDPNNDLARLGDTWPEPFDHDVGLRAERPSVLGLRLQVARDGLLAAVDRLVPRGRGMS